MLAQGLVVRFSALNYLKLSKQTTMDDSDKRLNATAGEFVDQTGAERGLLLTPVFDHIVL